MQSLSPCESIGELQQELIEFRRDLHAHPELGFQERRTSGLVAGMLEALGITVYRNIGKTGVVGVLRGKRYDSGRMIGLRADMDALPMQETNSFGHASTVPGLMHGCGHDGHTAILMGAAKYLAKTRNFDGTVIFIFQPAEEGLGGAKAMIDDGLFERFDCDAVYALHNWPGLPAGMIGINSGPMMAAADRFEVVIQGRGGHGAHPYQTIDPVLVASHIITALQSVVSRNVSALDAAVVTVASVHAGDPLAMSVIPDQAKLVGTVRTFRHSIQSMVEQRMRGLIEQIALGFGATASLTYQKIYPATINTPKEAMFVADVATELLGADKVVRDLQPSMGAEDFSFMLQHKPGAYFRLGQGGAEGGCYLHNPNYDFNDAVIPTGAGMFAALIEKSMPLSR
ncbi:MAG: M20 family metallopeptidase [Burkholderiaceae bacterium]|nr:M20 family metallopeptidase [Burkholderiaceae bacterium]MCD8515843.1 M20 family metallopeptidase [Burkholderiaceae bacterium]MCD8565740.1 M20 family metallopeptidase [Burkholderiaceae bacterium]